jgi:hypothetical protein
VGRHERAGAQADEGGSRGVGHRASRENPAAAVDHGCLAVVVVTQKSSSEGVQAGQGSPATSLTRRRSGVRVPQRPPPLSCGTAAQRAMAPPSSRRHPATSRRQRAVDGIEALDEAPIEGGEQVPVAVGRERRRGVAHAVWMEHRPALRTLAGELRSPGAAPSWLIELASHPPSGPQGVSWRLGRVAGGQRTRDKDEHCFGPSRTSRQPWRSTT